jgi:hypothetical protein
MYENICHKSKRPGKRSAAGYFPDVSPITARVTILSPNAIRSII